MVVYGLVILGVCLLLIFVPIIREVRARRVNPTPTMNNEDKRFIQIKNFKTRDMYESIKR